MFSCPDPHRKFELNSCIGQSRPPTAAAAALQQYSLKCTKCVFSGEKKKFLTPLKRPNAGEFSHGSDVIQTSAQCVLALKRNTSESKKKGH